MEEDKSRPEYYKIKKTGVGFMKVNELLRKSPKHFQLEGLKKEDLLPLFNQLTKLGYSEKNVYDRLGIADIEFILFKYLPIYLKQKLKENTSLDKLIKFFLLNQFLTKQEAVQIFSPEMLRFCTDVGLMGVDTEGFYSRVDLFPCLDGYFASDHRFTTIYGPGHVYPPGLDSYTLARGMIRERAESTLDLCTGNGIQAIIASRHSERVTGIDINPRAINFARFNALLNQTDNITFIEGNLYDPVENEKFDRILTNPPFIPAPHQKACSHDDEKSGEVVLQRMIEGVPRHLNDDGYAQAATILLFNEGIDYINKLKGWLKNAPVQLLTAANRYRDVETYISGYIHMGKDFDEYSDELIEWFNSYRKNKVFKLADGIISIKNTPYAEFSGDLRDIHPMRKPCCNEIKNYLDVLSHINDKSYYEEFFRSKFSISDDVDFWWDGMNKAGEKNYGVLFKNTAFFVDETLDCCRKEILDFVASGRNSGSEILEEFKRRTPCCGEMNENSMAKCLMGLVKSGIVVRETVD